MALSSAEKDVVRGWADQLGMVASWHTGERSGLVEKIVGEMRALVDGEAKAADLKKTSTEGADG